MLGPVWRRCLFALGHHVSMHKTGVEGVDVVYGVTCLTPERATPGRLLKLACGQGHTVLYHGPYRPERSLSQWAYSLRKNGH